VYTTDGYTADDDSYEVNLVVDDPDFAEPLEVNEEDEESSNSMLWLYVGVTLFLLTLVACACYIKRR